MDLRFFLVSLINYRTIIINITAGKFFEMSIQSWGSRSFKVILSETTYGFESNNNCCLHPIIYLIWTKNLVRTNNDL